MASQPQNRRGAWIALLLSWALALGIVAAGLGYAFLVPEEKSELEAMAAPEEAVAPPAADPGSEPAQSGGETDTTSPGPETIEEEATVESPPTSDPGDLEATAPETQAPETQAAEGQTPELETPETQTPELQAEAAPEAFPADPDAPAADEASTTDEAAPEAPPAAPETEPESIPVPPEPKVEKWAAEAAAEAAEEEEAKPATPAPPAGEGQEEAAQSEAAPAADTEAAQEGEAAPESEAEVPPQTAALPVPQPEIEPKGAWQRFGIPFNQEDTRPRVAVVVSGLGLADAPTEAAIKLLPPEVTLSFTPYARDLEPWIALARANGHEVMLDLPMEPLTFPTDDPGPQALISTLPTSENRRRLNWILSRGSAYVGLAGSMGSRFSTSRELMMPILNELKAHGLLYLDNRSTDLSVGASLAAEIGLPRVINNRSIDERQASRLAIDARLAQVERVALTEGHAVAMARPFPVTLERLTGWIKKLEDRGIVLAPITALADRQALR